MTQPAARITWDKVLALLFPAAGCIAIVGGAFRADGGRDKQIDDNTRRIERLETADTEKRDTLNKIDGRTIRIETTLQMIVPAKEQAPHD